MDVAETVHCDVTAAALLSLKREKKVQYDGMMLLLPVHADVVISAGGASPGKPAKPAEPPQERVSAVTRANRQTAPKPNPTPAQARTSAPASAGPPSPPRRPATPPPKRPVTPPFKRESPPPAAPPPAAPTQREARGMADEAERLLASLEEVF
jgi:hypothetical protein